MLAQSNGRVLDGGVQRCSGFTEFFMKALDWPELQSMQKYWVFPQQNKVSPLGFVSPATLLTFLSVSPLSLPSSTSSLKVQSASSSRITELPRSCGRSASSITPSSGENWSGLMVGRFLSDQYKHTNISRCTTVSGAPHTVHYYSAL